jgi:hypothetical protein
MFAVVGCNIYTGVQMEGIQNKKCISRKLIVIHVSDLCHRKGKLKVFSFPAYAHAPAGDVNLLHGRAVGSGTTN